MVTMVTMNDSARVTRRLAAVALLLLAGCFKLGRPTPPVEQYVLGGSGTAANPVSNADPGTLAIGLRRLDLADYLATRLIVVRRGTHQIVVTDFRRWGEDPGDGINRSLAAHLRAAPPVASLVAVKDHVLGGQLRGKIRKCVGPVQAWEVEVRSLEAVLLEQRAEDVNRIITPLERFGIIHLWEIPTPGRGHPLAGSAFGRVGGTQGWVVVERQPDSLLQAERFLCLQRRWPSQHSQRRHARQEANRNQCFSQPARRFPPSAIVLE